MPIAEQSACAITYRATSAAAGEVEIRLVMRPDRATMPDAWARLAAAHGDVDPRSIEIELRARAAPRPKPDGGAGTVHRIAVIRAEPATSSPAARSKRR